MNKKSMYVAAFLTLSSMVGVNANESLNGGINGRIVDAQSQVLPGASIYVKELQTGVISDYNGCFALPRLSPGKYTLEISYLGYKPFQLVVDVTSDLIF